jgi:hypothetical protein
MLPGPTAPRSLAGLLAEFRPCFTAPTFQTFIGPDLHRAGGRSDRADPPPNGVWDAHRRRAGAGVASRPRTPIVHLLPAGSPLTVAVDDTLFKRSGKKVFGAAWHHDGAAKGPIPISFGNCWVVAQTWPRRANLSDQPVHAVSALVMIRSPTAPSPRHRVRFRQGAAMAAQFLAQCRSAGLYPLSRGE